MGSHWLGHSRVHRRVQGGHRWSHCNRALRVLEADHHQHGRHRLHHARSVAAVRLSISTQKVSLQAKCESAQDQHVHALLYSNSAVLPAASHGLLRHQCPLPFLPHFADFHHQRLPGHLYQYLPLGYYQHYLHAQQVTKAQLTHDPFRNAIKKNERGTWRFICTGQRLRLKYQKIPRIERQQKNILPRVRQR